MKNMFFSSKGKGNGVNTTNRCMGCTKDCESCFFKDAADQINKAAEEGGPVMSEQQKDVDRQKELHDGDMINPISEEFPASDSEKFLIRVCPKSAII